MTPKKSNINLIVIGDVDSGRSTITGHLIYSNGDNSPILHELKAERERGVKLNESFGNFCTPKYNFIITDTSGHRNFIKNVITGKSKADCALLVVSALPEESKIAMSENSQTLNQLSLSFALGIKQLVIAINKMDNLLENEQHYLNIKDKLSIHIKNIGYDINEVNFVPISGLKGDNIFEKSSNLQWYGGPTLLELLDKIKTSKSLSDKPIRVPIQDVHKVGVIGTVLTGRIESGILKQKINIKIAPGNIETTLDSIEAHYLIIKDYFPGENIGLNVKNLSIKDVKRGMVVGSATNDPPCQVHDFIAHVTVLDGEIKVGSIFVINCHTAKVECKFTEIHKIDIRTGKELDKNAKCIKSGNSAIIHLVPLEPLCIEKFADYPTLGRFFVKNKKSTIAVGIVNRRNIK